MQIKLDQITKHFDGVPAIVDVSLDIPQGKTTVLIGPSGCGKSTLLRTIIGLITPNSGRVVINGTPLAETDLLNLRHKMGFVIQEGGLFPHMTALENITFMAGLKGWEVSAIQSRVNELVQLTRFPENALSRYPQEISGGQRQRVSLMRALMLDPDGLLLDEPLGALDPLIRADLQKDMVSIFKELGKTVILVTHDMAEAASFGENIVLMRDGNIHQQGSLADLLKRPVDSFVKEFIHAQLDPWKLLERMGQ